MLAPAVGLRLHWSHPSFSCQGVVALAALMGQTDINPTAAISLQHLTDLAGMSDAAHG
jgi:hypothetical protein